MFIVRNSIHDLSSHEIHKHTKFVYRIARLCVFKFFDGIARIVAKYAALYMIAVYNYGVGELDDFVGFAGGGGAIKIFGTWTRV